MANPQVTPLEPVDVWANLRRDQQGRALCHAHSTRSGELCNAPAVRGMTVCRTHGGASRQARDKAKLRLAELVDPAIATLAREMATAETSADRQRAANSILDRAGWGRVTTIEAGDVRELLIARLLSMRDQAAELDQVYEPEAFDQTYEETVVDADPAPGL